MGDWEEGGELAIIEIEHVLNHEKDELTDLRAKADALAEVIDTPDQSNGIEGRYHYDWHRVDDAIAAYRATQEAKE
jgi:hypothetical protein